MIKILILEFQANSTTTYYMASLNCIFSKLQATMLQNSAIFCPQFFLLEMHFISTSTYTRYILYDLKSTMIPEFACKAVDETTKALWLQKVYLRIVMDMREEEEGMGF